MKFTFIFWITSNKSRFCSCRFEICEKTQRYKRNVYEMAVNVRVPTEEQAREGYSLAAQTDKIVAHIKSKGRTYLQIYNDDGYSAARRRGPTRSRMPADAVLRQFEAVLV